MPILTVTLNPAVDVAADVDELVPNRKMRCAAPSVDPGGGGVNVSRAIRILGGTSRALVAIGGPTGDHLVQLLHGEGLDPVELAIDGDTRQSFTANVRATNDQYRFVLPGPTWSADDVGRLRRLALEESAPGDLVVLSGSLPPGLPPTTYCSLAEDFEEQGRRVVVDTSGASLVAFLHAHLRPCAIRMNRPEAQELAGRELESFEDLSRFAGALLAEGFAQLVVIAHGAEGALFRTDDEEVIVPAPRTERRSAVGAGDSFVGALVLGLEAGWSLTAIACHASAAAASAITTSGTELCRRDDTERMARELAAGLAGD